MPSIPFFAVETSRQITYAMLVLYGVLALASFGVMIASRSPQPSRLRSQVNAWWAIFPVVSVSLLLYPAGPLLLFGLIGIFALRDLSQSNGRQKSRFYFIGAIILALTLLGMQFAPPIVMLAQPILLAGQLGRFLKTRGSKHLPLLLFFVVCYGLSFLIWLMQLPMPNGQNIAWLFFLFVLTALNDIGQFIAGTCFGKHKLAPRISPNKTLEGLAGGIVISISVASLLGSYLQLAHLTLLIPCAIMLSLGGLAGDLMFSAAKRHFGIKDFSTLIPGHGGMLDRVDSLVITAPLLYFALTLSY